MRLSLVFVITLALSACVRTSSVPLAQNMVQVTASAPPACGISSARDVSIRLAAIETIKNGFDSFIVLDAAAADNVRAIGRTPVTSYSTSSAYVMGNNVYGNSTTTYSGGYPIVGGSRDVSLVVQMFRPGDPGFGNAISAKAFLGPDWAAQVASNTFSC